MKTNGKDKTNGREKRKRAKEYSVETRLIYGQPDDPHWDYSHHLIPPISASATVAAPTGPINRFAGPRRPGRDRHGGAGVGLLRSFHANA